jgi:tetratricopeptide (TPR) repeat protein
VTDPIGTQENVARTIVWRFQSEVMTRGSPASGARRPTENLAAHNLYLQGRYHLNQRTEEALRKAVDFFEKSDRRGRAIRYPTAHHWYAMSCLAPMERLDDALDEMLLAQSLDPVSSIIVRDVAVIHFYRRDFDAALDRCDHTIELDPHFSLAYLTLGFVQEQREDFDESAAAFQRAIHLSPQTPRMHAALGRSCVR